MTLKRRELLSGLTPRSCHIVSLVVHCSPERQAKIVRVIERMRATEVPLQDPKGKVVVLLEMENEAELLDRISSVQSISGVISANLVFHQIDDEDAHDARGNH